MTSGFAPFRRSSRMPEDFTYEATYAATRLPVNLASTYSGGRMGYQFEEPVHRFQNMVIDRLVGVDRVPGGDPPDALPAFTLPPAMSAAP